MNKIDEINALAEDFIKLSDDEMNSKEQKYKNEICKILYFDILGARKHPNKLNFGKKEITVSAFNEAFMYSWKKFCGETSTDRTKFFSLFITKAGYEMIDEYRKEKRHKDKEYSLEAEIGTSDDDSNGWTLDNTQGFVDNEFDTIQREEGIINFGIFFANLFRSGKLKVQTSRCYTHAFIINGVTQIKVSDNINKNSETMLAPCDVRYIRQMKKIGDNGPRNLREINGVGFSQYVIDNKLNNENTLNLKAMELFYNVSERTPYRWMEDYFIPYRDELVRYLANVE